MADWQVGNLLFPDSAKRRPGEKRQWHRQKRVVQPPVMPTRGLLAIDPSSKCTGLAYFTPLMGCATYWLRRFDSINLEPYPPADRFEHLARVLRNIILDLQPSHAIIETPGGGQRFNFEVIKAYCMSIGVCHATCVLCGLDVRTINVLEWKGATKKEQTALVIKRRIQADNMPAFANDNESDAVGIGMNYFDRLNLAWNACRWNPLGTTAADHPDTSLAR